MFNLGFLKRIKNRDENLPCLSAGRFANFPPSSTHYLPAQAGSLPTSKGFLLIEVIVAVALFSVVMTVGIVALLSLVQANERSQRFKVVVNNMNLALESMSKEIRVGTNFCDTSIGLPPCTETAFSFISKDIEEVVYRLSSNNTIERSIDGGSFMDITANDIVVDKLEFIARGYGIGDGQPKVEISVGGHSGLRNMDEIKFDLQSIVSQRTIMD